MTLWRLVSDGLYKFPDPLGSPGPPGTSGCRFLLRFFGFVVESCGTLAAVSTPF